jgi:uncharacterized protein YjbI with pentapeptide repeats
MNYFWVYRQVGLVLRGADLICTNLRDADLNGAWT